MRNSRRVSGGWSDHERRDTMVRRTNNGYEPPDLTAGQH